MVAGIVSLQYWPSFKDSPKYAAIGSALTEEVFVYAKFSKYGLWKAEAAIPEFPAATDDTIDPMWYASNPGHA